MADGKTLRKVIKSHMTPFAKKHGFKFTKPTLLMRRNGSVLHIIAFQLSGYGLGFYCNIAVQPLYYPDDIVCLGFGDRLNHFKTNVAGRWGYGTEAETGKDLDEVIRLLETNVLPWFAEVGSPEGIVAFLSNEYSRREPTLFLTLDPFLGYTYLGFSYLYLGEYELADNALKRVFERFDEDDTRGWVLRLKELINYVRTLAKNDPTKVRGQLEAYIQQTVQNLKLK